MRGIRHAPKSGYGRHARTPDKNPARKTIFSVPGILNLNPGATVSKRLREWCRAKPLSEKFYSLKKNPIITFSKRRNKRHALSVIFVWQFGGFDCSYFSVPANGAFTKTTNNKRNIYGTRFRRKRNRRACVVFYTGIGAAGPGKTCCSCAVFHLVFSSIRVKRDIHHTHNNSASGPHMVHCKRRPVFAEKIAERNALITPM